MIEVLATDEFVAWYDTISVDEALAIERALTYLEVLGQVAGASSGEGFSPGPVPLYELRMPGAANHIVICYAFHLVRQVVLLLRGDRTGRVNLCADLALTEAIWDDVHHAHGGNGSGGNGRG